MAGYIVAVGGKTEKEKLAIMNNMFCKGIYGTLFNPTKGTVWNQQQEGTFSDYLSMKDGDYIFFFADRKIYGVGRLKNLVIDGSINDCKFLNYPDADIPAFQDDLGSDITLDYDNNPSKEKESFPRVICTFEPYPHFYNDGIDMDEILQSNQDCYKMLRVFWKRSFIKIDDSEAECLLNAALKKLKDRNSNCETKFKEKHRELVGKLNKNYIFNAKNILRFAVDKKDSSKIGHEMAIEAEVVYQLTNIGKFPETKNVFGRWDYISHQVVASPFKPVDYMDKMDIFAYQYLTYQPDIKIRDMHCVIELKKDSAENEDVEQTLKYVDWLKDEYTGQDYSVIKAFLVAASIPGSVKIHLKNVANRKYQIGRRPTMTAEWSDLRLIEYTYNNKTSQLDFIDVTDK
jgi:hypothetical protein